MKSVYLLIKCRQGSEGLVIKRLKMIGGIRQCEEIIGTFDILARFESVIPEEITSIVHGIKEVQKITCLDCMESYAQAGFVV